MLGRVIFVRSLTRLPALDIKSGFRAAWLDMPIPTSSCWVSIPVVNLPADACDQAPVLGSTRPGHCRQRAGQPSQHLDICRTCQTHAHLFTATFNSMLWAHLQMPVIERQTSGPLSLGTGASIQGSPVGTPTSASPTGYGASFKTGEFAASPPASPVAETPEQVRHAMCLCNFS